MYRTSQFAQYKAMSSHYGQNFLQRTRILYKHAIFFMSEEIVTYNGKHCK